MLTRELWSTVEPFLDEALDLGPEERSTLLARLRGRSPAAAAELEAILAFETTDVTGLLGEVRLPAPGEGGLAGQTLGGYTLDRPLGHGGMGAVWLAHRSDGRFEGQAAVKLLHLAVLGREGEARFRREGSVLARLTHPNIARLLDAGVTRAGQPYLVLEHVAGSPIDVFADAHRLSPEGRVALCLDVLSAVGAAHASLVVHRDIKPSNVLVGPEGATRLLDFGIAKLLEGPGGEAPALTEDGGGALTPEYAAPELVLGEPVSTATDVYSVGVLLYLLLCGRHPTGHGCRTRTEHLRALLEVDPPLLSAAVAADAAASREEAAVRAAARSSTPEQLVRRYRGDLDNILARALSKRPAERYPTAAAFADDLVRFTRHEPVRARPASLRYRGARFLRRHRAGVLAAAVAALSLVGATGFSTWQMLLAREERDNADQALRRSRATTAFESLLFRLLEPGGEALTYRQLLDRGREALELQYRTDPISRIQLSVQFSMHYLREGDVEEGAAVLRRAVALADSIDDAHWRGRARCELAFALAQGGPPDSALALVARARRILDEVGDLERGTANACDGAQGEALLRAGRADSAAVYFARVAERFASVGDTTTDDWVYALNDHARALHDAGRTREAREIVLRLLEIGRAGAVTDPWGTIIMAFNASAAYEQLGEFQGRAALLRRELRLAAADSGWGVHPLLAFEYARTLDALEAPDSAAVWYARALEGGIGSLDPADPAVAHLGLARLARRAGHSAEAERHLAEGSALGPTIRASSTASGLWAAHRIEALVGNRGGGGLAAAVALELDSLRAAHGSSRGIVPALLAAAAALTGAGAHAEAVRYAAEAGRLARRDSLTLRRSGTVGLALLLEGRAELAGGDSARARERVAGSVEPLGFGYGAGHPLARQAVALLDTLGG